MINPKVSVIIPIYNCEQYLEETLNSLLNQTILEDIEVLMIDDGSTDNSRYIIEKYDLDYHNFHAFHKENEGQGIARNYGLDKAKGEYVHFFDSDDYLIPEAYEKLYSLAKSNDYDFVVCNVMRFAKYNCWHDQLFRNSFGNLSENIEFHSIDDCPSLVWDSIAANKLYKMEFLQKNNLKFFNKKIFYEDLLYSIESYINANSFCFLNEYCYFWRLRTDNSSVTQHHNSLDNFKDRIEIIKLIIKVIKSKLSDKTLNKLYEKWLVHDFKLFIKHINEFPAQYHEEILNEILDIVNDIPQEVLDSLNSYYNTIYRMLKSKDIENLIYFAPLEDSLKADPDFNLELDDCYAQNIDFSKDALDEDLLVEISNIEHNEKDTLITFEYKLNYFSDGVHKLEALLIDDENNSEILKIDDNQIVLPFDLLMNKKHAKIKMKLITDSFIKESYLKNQHRMSIIYNNRDIELQFGINSIFKTNIRDVNGQKAVISDIEFDNEDFIFKGNCMSKFESVFIENIVSFEKITYPVIFKDNDFYFKIPYHDLLKSVIKKWELKSNDLIQLSSKYNFYHEYDKVLFENYRNKILVYDDLFDKFEKLNGLDNKLEKYESDNLELQKKNNKLQEKNSKLKDKNSKLKEKNANLKEKNKKLKEKNSKLKDKNKKLNETIDEYKSRKVVKLVDNLKK